MKQEDIDQILYLLDLTVRTLCSIETAVHSQDSKISNLTAILEKDKT